MDESERRVGINETLFRDVNERVRELDRSFAGPAEPLSLVCECGDGACVERVVLTVEEYEAVRAHGNHFVIVPGHEIPSVEIVVATYDRYMVVAKRLGGPAELAHERDPRAAPEG